MSKSTLFTETTDYPHGKKLRWIPAFASYTEISSRWLRDLNVKGKTLSLVRKNREYLYDPAYKQTIMIGD